jgi:hypothetical protein
VASRGFRRWRKHALISVLILVLGSACANSASRSANPPSSSVSPPAPAPDPVRGLIPNDAVQADIMSVKVSARYDALVAKISAATKSDPTAVLDQVKAAAPGQPMPYSPRLGLTKKEYEEFLGELEKKVHLEKVAEATLRFTPESGSRFRLDGGDGLKQLSGVVIDLQRNVVETPLGVCSERSDFSASENQATGPANGSKWALEQEDVNSNSATSVSLVLGRIVATNRVFLTYTARRMVGGKLDAPVEVVVTYSHA